MESSLLSQMEELMSAKLRDFEQRINVNQRELSQSQLSAIQQSIGGSDTYTFRRKGHEEQFKSNARILDNLNQANGFLQDASTGNMEALSGAKEKIVEGIQYINHRQKCIKLADSSVHGWKVVQEYVCNPLADDSDDEKRIQRAYNQAERKARQGRRYSGRRYRPYMSPTEPNKDATETTQTSTNRPARPGSCFRCGRLGHWRADCKAVMEPVVISKNVQKSSYSLSCNLDESKSEKRYLINNDMTEDSNANLASPVGRLKNCIQHWRNANANSYILDVIQNGYKLPFMNIPCSIELRNNKSALDNPVFVREEIAKLLKKGCIREEHSAPYIVNPLTVAFGKSGKPRLVLDCRHINPELFKFKCHYEDHVVARQLFSEGDFLFTFDVRGAYHHIMIYPEHCTYLGFAWHDGERKRYYCYTVLAFGISTAGCIFTKVMRTVVEKWRSLGYKVVVFLDDGMGGEKGYKKACVASRFMKSDLVDFGFLIADEKCCWEPKQFARWLGLDWDAETGTIAVVQERMARALELLDILIVRVQSGKVWISVRLLAAMVGQLLSMQCVMGKVVRLHSRFLYGCLAERTSWNSSVVLNEFALQELMFWKKNLSNLNKCKFRESGIMFCGSECTSIYVDASSTGYGGFIDGLESSQMSGTWSAAEAGSSSTWRELEAIRRYIRTFEDELRGKQVCVKPDSKNACSIMHIGSGERDLQTIALGLEKVCSQNDIDLRSVWIPREMNKKADTLSRIFDGDDWSVCNEVYSKVSEIWGPFTFDRFAHDYNAKCTRFNSRFWCPGTSGIDAFNFDWSGENNWVVPPPVLIAKCIRKIQKEKCKCALVVPEWKSAPFWPLLFPTENESEIITGSIFFKPGVLTKRGRGKNGLGLKQRINEEIERAGVNRDHVEGLAEMMAGYLVDSRADSTVCKYYSYFKRWENFVVTKGGLAIPASPVLVALYITELMRTRCSYSVISSTIFSIKWAHSLKNLADPTDNLYVKNLLESAKRTLSKPVLKKEPVGKDLLVELCNKYGDSSDILIIRDLCIISLGFAAFLRYDEIKNLRCNDISMFDGHFSLKIRKSKTDRYRQGDEMVIARGSTAACPYRILSRYLELSGQTTDMNMYLFRPCYRSKLICKLITKDKPLSYTRARETILKRIKEISPSSNFGLHSGGATLAANSGVHDRCWKRHGRWRSESSKDGYVVDSLESRLEISRQLGL